MKPASRKEQGIRLGIVGGGSRCRMLLEMFERGLFQDFKGKVVAVADLNPHAPGMIKARKMGLITTDYNDLLNHKDVDLVVELTGDHAIRNALEQRLPPHQEKKLRSINRLLYELLRVRAKEIEAESELQSTFTFLKTILDGIQENIMVVDTNYRIVDVNASLLRNIGHTKEEVIGKTCYQVSHRNLTPCSSPDHPCPLREVLETGNMARSTHKHYTLEGKKYYEIVIYPIKDGDGKITNVIEMSRDVSEVVNSRVRKTTERLKRDYSRLVMEDKMISLGKMMASVVHEINNPLSGTLNLARLVNSNLKDGIKDQVQLEENLQYLELICSELERSSTIVSHLLSFSRQNAKEEKWVNINEVMDRVLAIANHRIKLQQIELKRSYDESLPEIRFQAGQLDQTFMNIVFNAIEAMPDGGGLFICTRMNKEENQALISVKDTGCGISDKDLLKIFEPFFSTKGEAKGVGLGLSVVHGIIKAHGGDTKVKSELGKGTEFVIKLPLADS